MVYTGRQERDEWRCECGFSLITALGPQRRNVGVKKCVRALIVARGYECNVTLAGIRFESDREVRIERYELDRSTTTG